MEADKLKCRFPNRPLALYLLLNSLLAGILGIYFAFALQTAVLPFSCLQKPECVHILPALLWNVDLWSANAPPRTPILLRLQVSPKDCGCLCEGESSPQDSRTFARYGVNIKRCQRQKKKINSRSKSIRREKYSIRSPRGRIDYYPNPCKILRKCPE